jgi:hypothetical protein
MIGGNKKGYSHISATNFLAFNESHLAPALPPLGAHGACDSSVLPVYLILSNTTLSQPGRYSGGAKPLESQRF